MNYIMGPTFNLLQKLQIEGSFYEDFSESTTGWGYIDDLEPMDLLGAKMPEIETEED